LILAGIVVPFRLVPHGRGGHSKPGAPRNRTGFSPAGERMCDLVEEYHWRGMIQDLTEGANEAFSEGSKTAYIGFDPTASSLHVGSLLPIMGLVHLQRRGHHPIAVVGGGTGLIGDPSGKAQERPLLSREQMEENLAGIRSQLERFLDFDVSTNPARIVNNLDWLGELKVVEFLRDIGKHFSVNALLRKESVRRRLEDEDGGISFTEFAYALMQAFDFLVLYDRYDCTVQMGGSDQWGNITAGIDLIRRMRGVRAFGLVYPLVTSATGTKFGKTEAGTVWLDPGRTSPYRFYQYWLNTDDQDALRYLRYFTLLSRAEVGDLEGQLRERPHERAAQRALAETVTRNVHGETGLAQARQATQVLFGGTLEGLGEADLADIFADVPSSEVPRTDLEGQGTPVVDLLAGSGVASSKGDARRSMEGGGIYLNNVRVDDVERTATHSDLLAGRFLLLRKGKKSYHLIKVRG
jgi:tyrosyl-tRNA synthetase